VGQAIASFKKPHFVEFVDELPKGEDGAIDREAVKARHAEA
jgi:acyl-coenzyme A synthetase/AMP-(fatty) acid ligase